MDGDALYSIGDLARRTGLTVKTIRFYSDSGIVPPTDRSPAGYRLYDIDALARLDLVRTLRDLGLDLAAIRQVLDREISLPEVAAAHLGGEPSTLDEFLLPGTAEVSPLISAVEPTLEPSKVSHVVHAIACHSSPPSSRPSRSFEHEEQ